MSEQAKRTTCGAEVSDHGGFHFHDCGKPLRTDEQRAIGLCGRHLAGQKRREASARERAKRAEAKNARLASARALCERLALRGITAKPDYETGAGRGSYTGFVVVNGEEVLAALGEAPDGE